MQGLRFSKYKGKSQSTFDRLLEVFKELLLHSSGDVDEAIDWLRALDQEYELSTKDYTIDDFIEDLKKKGFLREEIDDGGGSGLAMTAKTERAIRHRALEQVFGKLKKSQTGNHQTKHAGPGDENSSDHRPYQFGDSLEQIDMPQSLKNAYANNGIDDLRMSQDDLVVNEQFYKAQLSTVLMIDISHSMILYGEDRITPAKRVALALAEFIKTRYPKDTLDIIVFGNDAWQIELEEVPYLKVGPYHTNTVAGLDLAMDLLRKKKNSNKQIFMITDGKPSCLHEPDGSYYKNSFGLDDYIVGKCYNRAAACRRAGIPITTFMIAQDPYLQQFVEHFTQANKGKAFYTGLNGLGDFIFQDYENNRKRRIN
ncbi:vWA domain-containing protein [Croceimicrobium hydrocarbonivorans]|uniref:VWA domain-containing protein n=1 Tax=Croceimicrobium hydrocarbonivorans TaxID=2761580 RepID=A0A7H0VDB1_9FLAO|nr:VWA domain-containing protein [Croceimicrobium hydrocarbonivorans]QNR23709.1 VWA domain-containing protein [Croceimicrobium hydrocarbonivorans]